MSEKTEKVDENYRRVPEVLYPSQGVTAEMLIERIDGEDLDTFVALTGSFTVSGAERNEFIAKLGKLINDYRI